MSTRRRKLRLNTITVSLGCTSGLCRRPKLSSFFTPKPKHHKSIPSSSTATWTNHSYSPKAVEGFGRIGGESVAVEKDSDDPYIDFRGSMLQMIMEKEIYSKEDLKELLNCFLQLNSPYYHGIIVRAFTEIWHTVFFGK